MCLIEWLCLQDEVETLREELTFKDHRLLEMEGEVKREREVVCSHENEVQSLLDKLAMEVEKNTQLSLELQEGSNGSEVRGGVRGGEVREERGRRMGRGE